MPFTLKDYFTGRRNCKVYINFRVNWKKFIHVIGSSLKFQILFASIFLTPKI